MRTIKEIKQKYYKKIDLLDLELIISRVIKKPREFVIAHSEHQLKKSQIVNLQSKIRRRMCHEPLAYILGYKEFYGLDFKVNKNTLIPRPETELMVDEALRGLASKLEAKPLKDKQNKIIFIDVGTGSGCIIITLAKKINRKSKIENRKFIAIDISKPALHTARQNAKLHGVNQKIKFLHGHLLEPILKNKKLDIRNYNLVILANLPYLTPGQIKSSPSIQYEPRLALDAGKDGLKYYRRLFKQIKTLLNSQKFVPPRRDSHIFAIIEIDPAQTAEIKKIIKNNFPAAKIKTKKDLQGLNRIITAKI